MGFFPYSAREFCQAKLYNNCKRNAFLLVFLKVMWHFIDLCGKIGLGRAQKIGEPQKQWMVDIMIAVQLAVNVLYQKMIEKQLRGEWTSDTLSALAISISTTGRTIFQVRNTYILLNCRYKHEHWRRKHIESGRGQTSQKS